MKTLALVLIFFASPSAWAVLSQESQDKAAKLAVACKQQPQAHCQSAGDGQGTYKVADVIQHRSAAYIGMDGGGTIRVQGGKIIVNPAQGVNPHYLDLSGPTPKLVPIPKD